MQGFIDPDTGEVSLNFDAEFKFNAGALYKVCNFSRHFPVPVLAFISTEISCCSHDCWQLLAGVDSQA